MWFELVGLKFLSSPPASRPTYSCVKCTAWPCAVSLSTDRSVSLIFGVTIRDVVIGPAFVGVVKLTVFLMGDGSPVAVYVKALVRLMFGAGREYEWGVRRYKRC